MKNVWPTKKLGDVCQQVTVGHFGITSPFYRDEGIRFLRTQNVGKTGLILDDIKYVTPEFHSSLKKSEVKSGDILMSRVITHTVHCALIPPELGPANCSNVVLVRPASTLLSEFLIYYIRSHLAQKHLLDRKVGSAQLVVNTTVVKNWPIPVPPLPEQQRIVAILDEAFEGIATATTNAEKNLANARELFESSLQSVITDKAHGWEKYTLKQMSLTFGRGKSKHRPRNDPKLYGGEYPFIQTGDVRNANHLITEFTQTYNETGLAQSMLWPKGTLCITIAANIAETGILNFDACFPDSVIGFVSDPSKSDVKFVEYLLSSYKAILQAKGKGSAQDNINLATFENELFPCPALQEQQIIVAKLDELSAETKKLEAIYQQKLAALTELKKSILHQAFSGQLQ